ncbi:hypothetical protein U3516DRAFT_656756 [Neocallimastix sp. 'constans']
MKNIIGGNNKNMKAWYFRMKIWLEMEKVTNDDERFQFILIERYHLNDDERFRYPENLTIGIWIDTVNYLTRIKQKLSVYDYENSIPIRTEIYEKISYTTEATCKKLRKKV